MEFTTAMSRLMLTLDLKTTSKVAAVLAGSDSMIDCLEFLRAFAWHDVHNIEEELYEAKLQKSTIVARAKEKLVSVFGRTRCVLRCLELTRCVWKGECGRISLACIEL